MINRSGRSHIIAAIAALVINAAAADVPPEYQGSTQVAARLGMTLFVNDAAASRASEFLVERGMLTRDDRVRGWLTSLSDDRKVVSVVFVGEGGDGPVALYLVTVPVLGGRLEIETLRQPKLLKGILLHLWQARRAAIEEFEARHDRCSEHFNSVVFTYRDSGKETILVYLLAATNKSNVAVTGGHIRYQLSATGSQIFSRREFSSDCEEVPLERGDRHSLAVVRQYGVPSEIDVYLSRQYSRPVRVATPSSGLSWMVDGPKIEMIGPNP